MYAKSNILKKYTYINIRLAQCPGLGQTLKFRNRRCCELNRLTESSTLGQFCKMKPCDVRFYL